MGSTLFTQIWKREVLKDVTTCVGMFDGLGVLNSYDDIIDKSMVNGFWTEIGRTEYFEDDDLYTSFIRWPRKDMVARTLGIPLDDHISTPR